MQLEFNLKNLCPYWFSSIELSSCIITWEEKDVMKLSLSFCCVLKAKSGVNWEGEEEEERPSIIGIKWNYFLHLRPPVTHFKFELQFLYG